MSREITANPEQLYGDGRWAARAALDDGVAAIDGKFGEGFSRTHPELLGAFIVAATQAGASANTNAISQDSFERLNGALQDLAEAVRSYSNE